MFLSSVATQILPSRQQLFSTGIGLVPSDRVKVAVRDGWITLSGEVNWFYQKNAAEAAVQHMVGVLGVTNMITIKPPVPTANVLEVKNGITGALKRNARLLRVAEKI